MADTPHDGQRPGRELVLDEVGGAGEFVRHRGRRHDKRVAVAIGTAGEVVEHDEAGSADGEVGLTVSPRSAERVRDDHADPSAGHCEEACAQATRRGVGVERQQHEPPGFHVRGVDTRRGHHEAVPGLRDHRVPPSGDLPDGLRRDGRKPVGTVDDPALGLAHDLAGDDDDVAVGQLGHRRGHERGEVVVRTDLRDTVGCEHPDVGHPAAPIEVASSSAAAAIPAVAGTSDIHSGLATATMPAAASGSTASASAESTSHPSRRPPRERAP